MVYQQFKILLKNNGLTIKKTEEMLGYGYKSSNNWRKKGLVPNKIVESLMLKLKQKSNEKLLNCTDHKRNIEISEKAYQIALSKSAQFDIDVNEYISSLIISNI